MAAVGASAPKTASEILAFISIAAVGAITLIALRRRWALALLRLVGATPAQIRALVRGEAALIVTVSLGGRSSGEVDPVSERLLERLRVAGVGIAGDAQGGIGVEHAGDLAAREL
jgi:hypothetical protein